MERICRYYLWDGKLHEEDITDSRKYKLNHEVIPVKAIPILEVGFNGESLTVKQLNQRASDYVNQAILMFNGMWDYDEDTETRLSEELITKISEYVDSSISKVVKKYHSFASEDMITAALGERLYEEFQHDGANIDIRFQSYSSVKKEPINGADLSFIFDITDKYGRRIIKSILIQSKKVKDSNRKYESLPRLEDQIKKMTRITSENYVLLYSKAGFKIFNSADRDERNSISSLFTNVLRCQNGDKSKSVLAASLDSKHLMHMSIEE